MSNRTTVDMVFVEDNPRDAEMTLRTLRKHHLANHVAHLRDGQEALDWLLGNGQEPLQGQTPTPKLMLLDLKLPKVDGLEVLRAIRSHPRTRLMPVVVMTSSREERDVIECYKLGVNGYVVKPMDFEGFSAAVAELGHYWLVLNQEPR